MGAFFKYETSMARTFAINTTTSKITRPNRPINHGDLYGAVIEIDDESCTVVGLKDNTTTLDAVLVVDGTITTLTYTKATNAFTLGETALTNEFIDSFGKKVTTS